MNIPSAFAVAPSFAAYWMFGQENRTLEILDRNIPVAFSRGHILYAYQCQSLERGKGSAVNVEMPLAVCVT